MLRKKGQVSTAIAVLLVVVALLASSALYLSLSLYQSRLTSSDANMVTQGRETLPLPSYGVATISSDQSDGTPASSANSIVVSGTGQISYTPNESMVQVSVQTDNATAVAATTSNAREMANVIRALNNIGISNSSIETQGYSLSANYANCYADSNCVPQIVGYSVINSLQVNITSSNPAALGLKAGQVIDTSVKAGGNGISLSFGASQSMLGQLTNEALQGAVASADNQAKVIASSLGVSISGVISASEGSSYYPSTFGSAVPLTVSSTQTPITVGTQTISATVYSIS
jgi:uncharacterized protein YggE